MSIVAQLKKTTLWMQEGAWQETREYLHTMLEKAIKRRHESAIFLIHKHIGDVYRLPASTCIELVLALEHYTAALTSIQKWGFENHGALKNAQEYLKYWSTKIINVDLKNLQQVYANKVNAVDEYEDLEKVENGICSTCQMEYKCLVQDVDEAVYCTACYEDYYALWTKPEKPVTSSTDVVKTASSHYEIDGPVLHYSPHEILLLRPLTSPLPEHLKEAAQSFGCLKSSKNKKKSKNNK